MEINEAKSPNIAFNFRIRNKSTNGNALVSFLINIKLLFCFLFFLIPLFCLGFVNDSIYDIDFSRILGTEIIEQKGDFSKILIVTNNNYSKKIKLSFYQISLNKNEMIEKKILPISFVSSEKEKELLKLVKLKNGNVLALTLTGDIERELVSRVISNNGTVIKEQKITENIAYQDIKVDLVDSIINISYYDINNNILTFITLNNNLDTLNKKTLKYEFSSENKFTFDKIFYKQDYAYCIEYNLLEYKDEAEKIPQFVFTKIDLKKGITVESTFFKPSFFIIKPTYFFNNNSIDIFFLFAQKHSNFLNCSLTSLKFDIENFNFKTVNYISNIWNDDIILENYDSIKKAIFSNNSYFKAKIKINKLKQELEFLNNFHRKIIYTINCDSIIDKYIFAYQTFMSYPILNDFHHYSDKMNSSITRSMHVYSNTYIFFVDKQNDDFKLLLEYQNSTKSEHINSKNKALTYFSIIPYKDKSSYIFTDITEFYSNPKESINFRILNNQAITSYNLSRPITNENINLELNTIKCIGENIFLCVASTKYEGDRLFIFSLN